MGVTNGFLRLTRQEFSELEQHVAAFEERCRNYDQSTYLDMDKAGYELLFMFDPMIANPDDPDAVSIAPAITQVLGGGTVVHEDLDLGYGPAHRIDDASLRASLEEFEDLEFVQCCELATSDIVSELIAVDEETLREYHWHYLQLLSQFITKAVEQDQIVIRY